MSPIIGTSYFLDGRRLSCQVRCFGSITVDLTEQVNKVDTQKKVKGVKFKDQKDIQAKQDTLILVDDPKANQPPAQPQQNQQQRQPQQQQQRPQHKPQAPKQQPANDPNQKKSNHTYNPNLKK